MRVLTLYLLCVYIPTVSTLGWDDCSNGTGRCDSSASHSFGPVVSVCVTHRVREAIAGGWLRFEHIPGTENPADIMTKPLPWFMLRVFVEPLLEGFRSQG